MILCSQNQFINIHSNEDRTIVKKVYSMGNYHALIISNKLPPPTPLKTPSARPLRGWLGGCCQEQTGRGWACVDFGGGWTYYPQLRKILYRIINHLIELSINLK